MRASFFLELLAQWDAAPLLDARNALVALHHELTPIASYQKQISQVFAEKLRELRSTKDPSYPKLLKFCSFFEAAGLMVRRGYVPFEDINGLFSGSIAFMETCFAQHIHERQKEPGTLPGLYENALYLIERLHGRSSI
jgi:hypothetical protein